MRIARLIVAALGVVPLAILSATAQPAQIVPIDTADYRALVRGARGGPVLVNFWATWCVPCVEEFPDVQRLRENYRARGLTVIAVSLDRPADTMTVVARFLRNRQEHGTMYIKKAGNDEAFINAVSPDWSGALPATFLYDPRGVLREMRIDKLSYDEMTSLITPYLQR